MGLQKEQTDICETQKKYKGGTLSLFDTCGIMVSSLGGCGIFIAMSAILVNTGSVAVTLIILPVCGLLNYSLARCFTEVAILLPKAGGPYFFILHVFGEFPAFLFMWGFVLLITTPVWAIFSYTASLYIGQLFFPGCRPPVIASKLLAICILSLVVCLNCVYMKYVTRVQSLLSSTKIVAMVMIIICGSYSFAKGKTDNFQNIFEGSSTSPGKIALSLLDGFFIYGGWQLITFLLAEMKEPERNLPRTLVISFSIVTILNELTIAAYFVLLSPEVLVSADAVAVLFMERLYKPLTPLVSLLVTTTSVGVLNASVLGHSNFLTAVAKKDHLPRIFGCFSDKYNMPWAASIFLCLLAVAVLLSGSLVQMIEFISFYAVVMSLSVLLCLFALRIRKPNAQRPVKVWLGTAIIQFILSVAILCMCIYQKPRNMFLAILIVASGIPAYFLGVVWKSKPMAFSSFMNNATVILQKVLLIKEKR